MKSSASFHGLFREGKLPFILFVMGIQALVTAIMTTAGLLELADTEQDIYLAVLYGLVVGSLFFIVWYAIFRKMCELKNDQKTRNWVLALSLLLAPVLFLTSSQYNVVALASDESIAAFYIQKVTDVQDHSAHNIQKAQQLKGLRADLELSAGSFKNAAKSEFDHGVLSGKNGRGTVYNALQSMEGRTGRTIKIIDESLIAIPQLQDRSEKLVGKMLAVLNSDDSRNVKEAHLKNLYTEFTALQAEMSIDKTVASIDRQLASMGSELRIMADFSPNQKIKMAQKEALLRLEDYVSEINEPVLASTALLLSTPTEPLKAIDAVTPMQATRLMWRQVMPQWSAALAIDYLPYAILLLLYISASGSTPRQNRKERLGTISFEEMLAIITAVNSVKDTRSNSKRSQEIESYLVGLDDEGEDQEVDNAPVK